VLPVCQRLGMGVLTWSPLAWGFLSGKYRRGQEVNLSAGRPALAPHRFDPAIAANAAKYDAVERLAAVADSAGCSLPQLAVAFAAVHPAVSSVILGPRTMEQLTGLLTGAALTLDDETLDRIDEIVPPWTNVYDPTDAFTPAARSDAALRRRPLATRAAA
jgi:aryl-alcohol dehydrogenase-like predicted oxidoreductase